MAANLILVVDDDEPTRDAYVHLLRKAGYQTRAACDGEEGLAVALEARPDLVLTDMQMPRVDGAELCRRIRATPGLEGTLVMVCSAVRRSSEDQADGLDAGADGYIAQPVSNREFLARVNAMMRLRRAELERDRVIAELRDALARLKTLSGIVPICMHCKKIRDDSGLWNRLELFIAEHSEAEFSHCLCPECLEKHYPEPE